MNKNNTEYELLRGLLVDFQDTTAIRVGFRYGDNTVIPGMENENRFCEYMKSRNGVCSRCTSHGETANPRSREIQTCPFGIRTVSMPFVIEGKATACFEYLCRSTEDADVCGTDDGIAQELLQEIPIMSNEDVAAAGRILNEIGLFSFSREYIPVINRSTESKIEEYVSAQYRSAINIDTACDALHISRSQLSHTLQKKRNTTFVKLLNRIRIENVCRLLDKGTKPEEAALECGFSSCEYMKLMFKKLRGISVKEYRLRSQGDNTAQKECTE